MAMDRTEMLRLFEAHREAEAARDIEAILETFVADCFLETMPVGLRSEGRYAVRAAYEMQFFSAFPDLAPEDEEAHFRLGFLLGRQNKLSEAIRHFQKVIALNPSNAGAHHNLGLVYLRTNQNDLAQKQMAQACKLDPKFCGKN